MPRTKSKPVRDTPAPAPEPTPPFARPELRAELVRHMDGSTLRAAVRSARFPEGVAEHAERAAAYRASAARRNYERALRRARNTADEVGYGDLDNELMAEYGRDANEPGPEHAKLVHSLWHERYKWGSPGYTLAYRANKAAREHAAVPRRYFSRAQKTALQKERLGGQPANSNSNSSGWNSTA